MKVRVSHASLGAFAFTVDPARAVILGRAAHEVDLELNWDPHVSRWHARLWMEDGVLWIQDLGSSNGTWRNDQRLIEPTTLTPGDSVRLGDTLVTLDENASLIDAPFGEEATLPGRTVAPARSPNMAWNERHGAFPNSGATTAPSLPAVQETQIPAAARSARARSAVPSPAARPPAPSPYVPALPVFATPVPSPMPVAPRGPDAPSVSSGPAPSLTPSAAMTADLVAAASPAMYLTPPSVSPLGRVAPPPPSVSPLQQPLRAAPISPVPQAAPTRVVAPAPRSPAPTPPQPVSARLTGPTGAFVAPQRLEVMFAGPAALRTVWVDHLSRGGVFVETPDDYPVQAPLELVLTTPHGQLVLSATVVHTAPAGPDAVAGLGLQITGMSAAAKKALVAYVDGRTVSLAVPRGDEPVSDGPEVEAAVAHARRLLDKIGTSDVYAALEIAPEATDAAIRERISVIAKTLASAARIAPPQKAARLEAAELALGRLAHALGDPMRRLEHDFMRGHVRAEARLVAAAAGAGPAVADLRAMWQRVAPEKVVRGAALSRDAFSTNERGDRDQAIRLARSALTENPFMEELRNVLAEWEKRGGDDSPPRLSRSHSTSRARR